MLVSQLWFEFQVEIYLGLVTFAWLNYLLSDLSCAHHLKKKKKLAEKFIIHLLRPVLTRKQNVKNTHKIK